MLRHPATHWAIKHMQADRALCKVKAMGCPLNVDDSNHQWSGVRVEPHFVSQIIALL